MNLTFEEDIAPRGWITKVWIVKSGMLRLGHIRWKDTWRRYWFEPYNAGFDSACLDEISLFLKQEMAKRKN